MYDHFYYIRLLVEFQCFRYSGILYVGTNIAARQIQTWQRKNTLDKSLSNDMVYDTMLGLMGVFNSGYNDKQDITSDKYNGDKKTLKVSHGKIELEKCL